MSEEAFLVFQFHVIGYVPTVLPKTSCSRRFSKSLEHYQDDNTKEEN